MSPPFLPEKIYHVYTHANGSDNLFRINDNYDYFLKKYQKYISPVAKTLAYCLMPNHFHFLIRLKNENEILASLDICNKDIDFSKVISLQWSHLLNGYSQAYNKMFDRRGSLFQPRIKRKPIDQDDYLTTVVLYIHWNPVKHGFVEKPIDWMFSSIHDYVYPSDTFIARDEIVNWFGNIEQFLNFHTGTVPVLSK